MSKKVGFTKGQWIAVGRRVEHPNDRIPDICSCIPEDFGQEGRSDDEACANARLIAAAPTMLKALRLSKAVIDLEIQVKEMTGGDHGLIEAYQDAVAEINYAITLATGEQS